MKATLALSKTLRAILEEDGSLRLEATVLNGAPPATAVFDPQETALLGVLLGGHSDTLHQMRQAFLAIRENSTDPTARLYARNALRLVAASE